MKEYKLTRINQVTKSAEEGNPESMFKLGMHYAYIALDDFAVGDKGAAYLQALYWFCKAASAKVWKAYYWLVKALEHGEEQYVDLLPELIKSKKALDFISVNTGKVS